MYFSDLGSISLILATIFAILAIALSIAGARRGHSGLVASAKRSVLAVTSFLLLASASLIISFLIHDLASAM